MKTTAAEKKTIRAIRATGIVTTGTEIGAYSEGEITEATTRNTSWGFYGTTRQLERGDRETWEAMAERSLSADAAWDCAIETLVAFYKLSIADARDFLDSKSGRHIADETTFGKVLGIILAEKWVAKAVREFIAYARKA